MSVTAIAAPTVANEGTEGVEGPVGPAAAAQRIQHLQDLIAQVQAGPASFVATLQAAQAGTAQASASQTGSTQLAATQTATPQIGMPQTGMPQTTTTQELPAGSYPTVTGPATIPASYSPSAADVSTLPAPGGNGTGSEYDALIEQAAARNGVDPAVLHGLIQQESGFDPSSTSSAGALGLTQLMPSTAASLGVTNPLDPAQSIEGGARYLGEMLRRFGGNTEDALAAYNAGPGAVQSYGGVPPYAETQQYVTKVLGYAAEYRSSHPGTVASPQAAIA